GRPGVVGLSDPPGSRAARFPGPSRADRALRHKARAVPTRLPTPGMGREVRSGESLARSHASSPLDRIGRAGTWCADGPRGVEGPSGNGSTATTPRPDGRLPPGRHEG